MNEEVQEAFDKFEQALRVDVGKKIEQHKNRLARTLKALYKKHHKKR